MYYVFIEDSTSGYDIIKCVIERVIVPKVNYRVVSLHGCGNVSRFENISSNKMRIRLGVEDYVIDSSDCVIFFIDKYSIYSMLLNDLSDALSISVYCCDYYCFESVLYSYDFRDRIVGDKSIIREFESFKKMLLTADFSNFIELLKYLKMQNFKGTPEQFANKLFVRYYSRSGCVLLNKDCYGNSLDEAYKFKSIGKAFYNNLCNSKEICNYCKSQRNKGLCRFTGRTIGNTASLHNLYYRSLLSKPLVPFKDGDEPKSLHEVLR